MYSLGCFKNTLFWSTAKNSCPMVTTGVKSLLIFFQNFWTMGTLRHFGLNFYSILRKSDISTPGELFQNFLNHFEIGTIVLVMKRALK